ncbi:hypothetical protein [Actinomadura sp. WMMA1423]|uniref:hypothetical protein n=1 Tax=Actinomadura sp. WMMA1423 TaxID=2591108 RepID=UPI0011462B6A|nr:hypothetical protein [Actinomadura sp. WMMA1423]
MSTRRLLLTLKRRGERVGDPVTVEADPDAPDWMRDHLVTFVEREGFPAARVAEFTLTIEDAPRGLPIVFAATERTR